MFKLWCTWHISLWYFCSWFFSGLKLNDCDCVEGTDVLGNREFCNCSVIGPTWTRYILNQSDAELYCSRIGHPCLPALQTVSLFELPLALSEIFCWSDWLLWLVFVIRNSIEMRFIRIFWYYYLPEVKIQKSKRSKSCLANIGSKFLKKLWCCIGEGYHKIFCFYLLSW